MFENDENRRYEVVRNDEEQYSIWPADRALPPGWTAVGMTGLKPACLEYIRREWTDLRPASLRNVTGDRDA